MPRRNPNYSILFNLFYFFKNTSWGSPETANKDPLVIVIDNETCRKVHLKGPFESKTLIYINSRNAKSITIDNSRGRKIGVRGLLGLLANFSSIGCLFKQ